MTVSRLLKSCAIPAGEPPDRLHLLRLPERASVAISRDVPGDADGGDDRSLVVVHERRGQRTRKTLPVLDRFQSVPRQP